MRWRKFNCERCGQEWRRKSKGKRLCPMCAGMSQKLAVQRFHYNHLNYHRDYQKKQREKLSKAKKLEKEKLRYKAKQLLDNINELLYVKNLKERADTEIRYEPGQIYRES